MNPEIKRYIDQQIARLKKELLALLNKNISQK
jgi:uncharacterized protein YejL (UPF0352 family)